MLAMSTYLRLDVYQHDSLLRDALKLRLDVVRKEGDVVDSSVPRRGLYLTTQLAELHIPMLLVFNMADEAHRKGIKFDLEKMEKYFGSPVVQTVGSRSGGVRSLLEKLSVTLDNLESHGVPMLSYGKDIDEAIAALAGKTENCITEKYQHIPARFFAVKLLEHDNSVMDLKEFFPVHEEAEKQIRHLRSVHAIEADTFMADRRYAMLAGACRDAISMNGERRREISDRIDLIMTNKYLGLPIFFLIIYATFYFTFIQLFKSLNNSCMNTFMSMSCIF